MTRIIPRDLIRHLEWSPGKAVPQQPRPQAAAAPSSPNSFAIDEQNDRYVISPIQYRGGLYQVSLSKELLDGGNSRTQDDWVDFLQGNEWQLPSGPLMMGLMTALYTERDGSYRDIIVAIQNKLNKDFKDFWMMTGTRIKYTPNGLDEVLHDYRLPESYAVATGIVGPDTWVNATTGCEEGIERLLGTRDLAAVENVSKWASTKKPYLWRINSKPSNEEVRALVLGVVNVRFVINAYDYINVSRPVRGVASQKIL